MARKVFRTAAVLNDLATGEATVLRSACQGNERCKDCRALINAINSIEGGFTVDFLESLPYDKLDELHTSLKKTGPAPKQRKERAMSREAIPPPPRPHSRLHTAERLSLATEIANSSLVKQWLADYDLTVCTDKQLKQLSTAARSYAKDEAAGFIPAPPTFLIGAVRQHCRSNTARQS